MPLLRLLVMGAILCVAPEYRADTPDHPARERWLLLYTGGHAPRYSSSSLVRLIAHTDSAGTPDYPVFTGVILLQLYTPAQPSHIFAAWMGGTPANRNDWHRYLDTLFARGGTLDQLDSSVVLMQRSISNAPRAFDVAIMVPYAVSGGSARAPVLEAYIDAVRERFRAAGFKSLRLNAMYWLREDIPQTDVALVTRLAGFVHALGMRFLWIPYYRAENWQDWRRFGFDEALLQPNYFFDPSIAPARLDSAVTLAQQHGMGLEIEFDGRAWSDPAFAGRLERYLEMLDRYPAVRAAPLALYEGGGALTLLGASRDAAQRALYDSVHAALR